MPWTIDHHEPEPDGTVNVCRVAWHDEDAKGRGRKKVYQLTTAIRIPPPGPGHGAAIAELRQIINALRTAPESPDLSAIEDVLNAGGD